MTTASERLWRTKDGGLVRDGDPDAATLAYAPGDEIAKDDESNVPSGRAKSQDKPVDKARRPAANKAGQKPADK
jgi:hypothetical protein